jgi:hypothetical protein
LAGGPLWRQTLIEKHLDTTSTPLTVYVPAVTARGSGVLNGIAVAGGIGYHYVRVTLDGDQLADEALSGIVGGPAHGNTGITVGLDFARELLIEVRNTVPSPQTVFWFSYTVSHESPRTETRQWRAIQGVEHIYRDTPLTSVLLGPAKSSYVSLENDTILPGEGVTGEVELRSTDGEPLYEQAVPLVLRAAGRTRRLVEITTLEGVEGRAVFSLPEGLVNAIWGGRFSQGSARAEYPPWALLPLELVVELDAYANYPSAPF